MDSNFSKLFKFFSNWIVYLLSLIVCGGIIYYLLNVNEEIMIQNVRSFNDLHNIAISIPTKFFPALLATLPVLFLAFFIIPITLKKFFKVHIVVPILLIAGNILGYYLGYGIYVFLANIAILVLAVIIVSFTVFISIPNQ